MTDNEWREAMARLDGWTYHSGQEIKENVRPWEDCRGQFTWDPLPYDTLEDMLRVVDVLAREGDWDFSLCNNCGNIWWVASLCRQHKKPYRFIEIDGDTPEAAIRQAIEKVIENEV